MPLPDPAHDPNLESNTPDPTHKKLEDFALPARFSTEESSPVLLYAGFSKEARSTLEAVQAKARQWFGEESSYDDSRAILNSSLTLFLTPEQKDEVSQIVDGTPLEMLSIQDLRQAIESGISGEAPYVEREDSRRDLEKLEYGINAGRALAELRATSDIPWKRHRELAVDIWNGLVQVQNVAASIFQNVQSDVRASLFKEFKEAGYATNEVKLQIELYRRADQLANEYTQQTEEFRLIQESMLDLARPLLQAESPAIKQIVYSMMESDLGLISQGLGLYDEDPAAMLTALDDWEAFLNVQIESLSRYFEEKEAFNSTMPQDSEQAEKAQAEFRSKWRPWMHMKGNMVALSAFQWEETLIDELKSEHVWGMKLIGVPGPIGDRAYEILSNLLDSANAKAMQCRPAYAIELYEREGIPFPRLSSLSATDQDAYERYKSELAEKKRDEAKKLIHGVSDVIIGNLPWKLPRKDFALQTDPALHLERTLTLIERMMNSGEESPGLVSAGRSAAQELAIQMENWDFFTQTLDTNTDLAERSRLLFEDVAKRLPDEWCPGLRERGILPAAETAQSSD